MMWTLMTRHWLTWYTTGGCCTCGLHIVPWSKGVEREGIWHRAQGPCFEMEDDSSLLGFFRRDFRDRQEG